MAKKKPARAKKPRSVSKKTSGGTKRTQPAKPTIVSLGRTARHADLLVRDAVREHAQTAFELDQSRQNRRAAARELGAFNAKEAEREGRRFYNFLVQGDSWFDYPCGFDIIAYLEDDDLFGRNAYFENIAEYGRKLGDMLSRDFKRRLAAGPPNAQHWDAVLFSGGGNDMCADHAFKKWLKPYDGLNSAPESYIAEAFGQELSAIQALYEQVIELVKKAPHSPRLFFHGYDFAIPDDRCVTGPNKGVKVDSAEARFCFAGPWLYPAFEERGFHKAGSDNGRTLSNAIVVAILGRFAAKLGELERKYPNQVTVVATQGTLTPVQATKNWANELHPENGPFKALAQKFYGKIRGLVQ